MQLDPAGASPSTVVHAPLSYSLFLQSRALHAYGAEMLATLGLHPGQELIVMQLLDRGGQTQVELQRSLGLDHSTVSRTIRRMEDAGLVDRGRSESDRRAMVVRLTAEGAALRGPLEKLWGTLESAVLHGLHGRTDATHVLNVTNAVTDALRDHRRQSRNNRSSGTRGERDRSADNSSVPVDGQTN